MNSPWTGRHILHTEWDEPVDTTISPKEVARIGASISEIPPDVKPHGRVQRIMDDRVKMAKGDVDMDWGFAETMAYASLLVEGHLKFASLARTAAAARSSIVTRSCTTN